MPDSGAFTPGPTCYLLPKLGAVCFVVAHRSQFVQVFGNSPDETAYYRMVLFRVSVPDAMVRGHNLLQGFHHKALPWPL